MNFTHAPESPHCKVGDKWSKPEGLSVRGSAPRSPEKREAAAVRPRSFTEKVLEVTKRIPRGRTLTYQEVAKRAGRPRAYRAVGNILNRYGGMENGIPCHRVIRSDGSVGGYAGGTLKKRKMLKKEKAIF